MVIITKYSNNMEIESPLNEKYIYEDDEIDGLMENMSLEEETGPLYNINQSLKPSNTRHVTTINMNFYQVWSIFRCMMPNVYDNGKSGYVHGLKYYEYIFVSQTDDIFTLYSYGDSFVNIKEWSIGTSTNNNSKIRHFMEHLLKAIECYENGYKGIEQLNFESDNPKIYMILQDIKTKLIKNKDILKTL